MYILYYDCILLQKNFSGNGGEFYRADAVDSGRNRAILHV